VLVSEVIERAYNEFLYPGDVNRPTYDKLATAMDGSVTSLTVTGRVQNIPRDTVLEIDSELMLVDTVTGNVVALHPTLGRGYLETAAVAHAQFAPVYIDPAYSRKVMLNALISVIGNVYAWGAYSRKTVSTLLFTTDGTIDLPAGAKKALKILAALGTSSPLRYNQLRRGIDYLEFEEFDPPKIQLLRGGTEGGFMQIVYKAEYTLPTVETDDLSALANPVPNTLQNYLPMAIAGYLLQGRDLSRVQIEEVRRALAAAGGQPGASINLANQMLNVFYNRYVQPEADRLRERDFGGIEFVRR
jgi:hypothetical protein